MTASNSVKPSARTPTERESALQEELRHEYSVDVLRQALFVALLIAGGLSLANLIIGNRRNLRRLLIAIHARQQR